MRIRYYYFLVWLLAQFIALQCVAQSYYFKRYQVDDGLSHNSVNCILQDSKGLIWIGTRGGLNRFDGYTFKTFTDPNSRHGNIGNNEVTLIAEDKKGVLWIGTGKGLFTYDPYKETLTPFNAIPQTYIRSLAIDDQNNVWLLADYNLYHLNQSKHKLIKTAVSGNCIALDNKMNLWVGDNNGLLNVYNRQAKLIKSRQIISKNIPLSQRSISKIYPLKNGKVLIGCFKQGLKSYEINTDSIRSLHLTDGPYTDIYVRDIIAGEGNNYWVGTENGIYIYNLDTDTSQNIRKSTGDPFALADNAVYTFMKDNLGGMWVGTYFGGLNYYSKENARFEKYYPQIGTNSISGNAVREICEDNHGNILIGTEDAGINVLNKSTKSFTKLSSAGTGKNVSYHNIHGLLAVGNQLYIGPFLHGMEIMDLRTREVTDRFKFVGSKGDNVSDFVLSIYLTKDSTLLVGTAYSGSGLFIYHPKEKSFTRIKQVPYNSYVYHVSEDNKGNIWTASVAQGAFYYNPKTGKRGNIRFASKKDGKFGYEAPLRYIRQDSDQNIWLATEGGGLIKLNPDLKTYKRYTTENGLVSNVVFCMLEDQFKHLWVSTLKGLVCIDIRSGQLSTYTQSNGLITDQFNYNSAFKDANGKMYFGTVKGMIAFDPAKFYKHETPPPTYITGFQVNNKEIVVGKNDKLLSRSILYTDSITLKHNQSNFSIEFAALNYSSPQVTRYKYLMKGLDKEWTFLNSNRRAFFTDLSPGNYTFIVQAESNTDNWVGKERRLFIKILPPFWKSNLAYGVYFILLGGILYLSIRYYHQYHARKSLNRQQLFEHEKEKEVYQAKIEFFTNIAHEIQTPLTLIVGPVERLVKKTETQPAVKKSLLMIERNANRLAELTAQLLDFRKTEMHQFGLNFVSTDVTKLLTEQIAIFKPEAVKSKINLSLTLPADKVVAFVDREAFIKICSNLISNGIKYAATDVTIIIKAPATGNETFSIYFTNDGKGIPEEYNERVFEPFFRLKGNSKPGTGIGLSLARSLAELHNGSLNLVKGQANLTTFELTLPVHQKFEFKLGSWKKLK